MVWDGELCWGLLLDCGLRELGGHRGWEDSGGVWPRGQSDPAGRGETEALGLGMDSGFLRALAAEPIPIPRAVGRGRLMLTGGRRQSSVPETSAASGAAGESWMVLAAAAAGCVLGTGAGQTQGGGRPMGPEAGDMAVLKGSETLLENEQLWFRCIGSINLKTK